MPPDAVATTTTSSTNALLQQIQSQAGNYGQDFMTVYFSHLTLLQVLSVVISVGLFAATVMIAIRTNYFRIRVQRFQHVVLKADISKKHAQEEWHKAELHFFKGDENDMKIAIMEADKILNEALRGAGIPGGNVGDRLKKAKPDQIPNLDQLWQAHKLRNQIAHEPGFKLKRDLAEKALAIYKVALENLGIFEGLKH